MLNTTSLNEQIVTEYSLSLYSKVPFSTIILFSITVRPPDYYFLPFCLEIFLASALLFPSAKAFLYLKSPAWSDWA